jgi:hypothetical protein
MIRKEIEEIVYQERWRSKNPEKTITDKICTLIADRLEQLNNTKPLPNLPLSTTMFLEIKVLIQELRGE